MGQKRVDNVNRLVEKWRSRTSCFKLWPCELDRPLICAHFDMGHKVKHEVLDQWKWEWLTWNGAGVKSSGNQDQCAKMKVNDELLQVMTLCIRWASCLCTLWYGSQSEAWGPWLVEMGMNDVEWCKNKLIIWIDKWKNEGQGRVASSCDLVN